jgi:hypothetical protein
MIQAGKSRIRLTMKSLDFLNFLNLSKGNYDCGINSVSNINEHKNIRLLKILWDLTEPYRGSYIFTLLYTI